MSQPPPPSAPPPAPGTGRVAAVYMDKCLVWTPHGQWVCTWRGSIKTQPVVGDLADFAPLTAETGEIARFLPRRSVLTRLAPHRGRHQQDKAQVLAANVEQVVIVAALHQPPFRDGLVFRILVAARSQGLPALLCLTKLDLDTGGEFAALRGRFAALGLPVLGTALSQAQTLAPLAQALAGRISILVGHSGVGKTSLINSLSDETLRVGEVGFFKDRGRHTTTTARLIPLRAGGLAIDAPGLREFGLHGLTPELLAEHFPGFAPHFGQCRFRNCRHGSEAGCAVRVAAERGELSEALYQGYLKLLGELTPG
ncbi:MAG: ribosome small subunit-dependent GTPase A [Candidatus Lambdaproteobacteria bacterium]|nr:ribosome small subunit-dependent GTPase A [Candidatus Lambdaproteobacteria bacterium]